MWRLAMYELNSNALVQAGLTTRDASAIMCKIFSTGCKVTNKRVDIVRANGRSVYTALTFQKTVSIDDAINRMSEWCNKVQYSKRANVAKWNEIVNLLKTMKESK